MTTEREAMRRRLLDKIVNAANASAVQRKRRPPWPKHARRCIVLRSKIWRGSADPSPDGGPNGGGWGGGFGHLPSSALGGGGQWVVVPTKARLS